MLPNRAPYSYLKDKKVPEFKGAEVFTVMDAHCALCARGANWIARHDSREEFTIIPVQSPVGSALLTHYGMDPADPTSWLYLEDGVAYSSLDALMRSGKRLGGVYKVLSVLRILPKFFQDFLYKAIARNRYKLFGTADMCSLPDPEVQKRLLK